MKATPPPATERLHWTTDVSLLGSPVVVRQTTGVFVVTFGLLSLFVCALFALEGDWGGLLASLAVLAAVHLGLIVAALLVMVLYFGNRIAMGFTLDARGVLSEVLEARARRAAQLATLLGLATGNFSVAGAGLLARSGARSFVPWKQIARVRFDEKRHSIHLCNRWRTVAVLFCTPASYSEAKAWVARMCSL